MTRTTARGRTFGGVLAAVTLLGLSACGGAAESGEVASAGGDANPSETEDTEPLDEDEQALVLAECVRDNGVDMPDPGPGQQGLVDAFQSVAGDYDRATLELALTACEDLIPQYAQEQQHEDDIMLALAECLREQGLDVSDDPFDDAHTSRIDIDEFTTAMEVCRNVLTGGGQ